jgi:signal transduction histidine kinase
MTDAANQATGGIASGEMAERIREHHWAATPLGPIARWPQSLRTVVELMLAARHPVYIAWGPENTSLYNDGYIPILGAKHPRALGVPYAAAWAEIWEEYRPLIHATMAGESQYFEDRPVPLAGRPGRPMSWFTFSWTPLRDESGTIAGFYCVAMETTERVLAEAALREDEARHTFLLRLGDALRPLTDPGAIQATAARLLGEHLGCAWTYYGESDNPPAVMTVKQCYQRAGMPGLAGDYPIASLAFRDTLKSGHSAIVADIGEHPWVSDGTRRQFGALGMRSFAGAPILNHGLLRAVFVVADTVVRSWTDQEIRLLEEVAERTWAAVEHAHAEAARRESEARYRALAAASADVIYRMGSDWSEMRLLEGRGFLADTPAPSTTWLETYIAPEDRPRITAVVAEAVRTRSVFELEHRVRRADGTLGWTFSRAVPLLDDRGEIMEWVGAAIDVTARKLAEEALRESEARQVLLLELADAIRPLADPVAIQAAASRLVGEQLAAERTYYVEFDDARELAIVAHDHVRGDVPALAGSHPLSAFGAFLGPLRAGVPVVASDALTDPRFAGGDRAGDEARPLRSFIAMPLRKAGQLVAALCVANDSPRAWTEAEVSLLREVAERTWEAVERSRVEAALRESEASLQRRVVEATSELRALSRKLLSVQEDERRFLARELHDEIGQVLTGLNFQLAAVRKDEKAALTEAQATVQALTEQVRQLSMDLRPAVLDRYGLLAAIEWYAERYETRTGIAVDLRHEGLGRRFSPEVEIGAYRVMQEALTNVARHARASAATIQLFGDDRMLTVVVRDRGAGFDAAKATATSGLGGMRERMALLGGMLEVDSAAGRGTTITAEIPLHGPEGMATDSESGIGAER